MNRKEDEGSEVILGQKGKEKPDDKWILSLGREADEKKRQVKLNSANPHVIFVCGTRGSGKSYTLGVLAEEIATRDSALAAAIIDPIGVFWSMKYPNQEKREINLLKKMKMKPRGLKNVKILVPIGYKDKIPEETYDDDFSFKANSLNTEDWCLTFGIDRYDPQGLLIERAIEKTKSGYTRKLGDRIKGGSRDVPPKAEFSIDNLLDCINHDKELLSKEKGFSGNTRRALTSRLSAAKDWGIFGEGNKITDLIKSGMVSVFDISFLPENIGSLVLGILARKILAKRKTEARIEAVSEMNKEKKEERPIPPIWLMIDEAHSFAPSSGKTAATTTLIEYVKQGRRPGLSAVLSTQQPSALNSKIISQLDILISHRLSFDKDIKEVRKRMPTSLPNSLKEADSLKRLPEGTAITADKEIPEAFVTSIRPRTSQHEGRTRIRKPAEEEMASRRARIKMEEEPEGETTENEREKSFPPKGIEVTTLPPIIDTQKAISMAEKERERLLGFLWKTEKLERISRYYYPFWSILIDYYPKNEKSINLRLQVDGITGELVKKTNNGIGRTEGVRMVSNLNESENDVLFSILKEGPISYDNLRKSTKEKSKIEKAVESIIDVGLIRSFEEEGEDFYEIEKGLDIPLSFSERALLAAEDLPEKEKKRISEEKKIERTISDDRMLEIINSFGNIEIVERELLYYPYWIAEMSGAHESRILAIDGIFGSRDEYVERMVRRRIM